MKYCPTEEKKAGFFMKPLQGKLFRKFRDWLINIQDDDSIATKYPEYHRIVLKEVQNLKEYSINLTNFSREMINDYIDNYHQLEYWQ